MLDLDLLAQNRPFLYHLTARMNVASIINSRCLFSASLLLEHSDEPEPKSFLRARRPQHVIIKIKGESIQIRDQRPLSEKALSKCLDPDSKPADYYELLNNRVFLWPTIQRLQRHYQRYKDEKPVLFRFSTHQILSLNPRVEFSRLNSGATRANSYLGGVPPRRGRGTFCVAQKFAYTVSAVAEVTIPQQCLLPMTFESSNSPDGPWSAVSPQ